MHSNKNNYFISSPHGSPCGPVLCATVLDLILSACGGGGGVMFEKRDFALRGAHRPLEVSLLYVDTMKKIGLRIETPDGHDVKAGFGYFRRF